MSKFDQFNKAHKIIHNAEVQLSKLFGYQVNLSMYSSAEYKKNLSDVRQGIQNEIREIILKFEHSAGLPVGILIGKDRHRVVADYRSMCMNYVREKTKYGYEIIGLSFNRDHATVMAGIDKFRELNETDLDYRRLYEIVTKKIV